MPFKGQGGLALLLSGGVMLALLLVGMARVQRWYGIRGPVQFRTSDATGLDEGMDVRLSGMRIGQVDTIKLDPDTQVTVSLLIEPRYRGLLGSRSRVRLEQENLIGGAHLAISPDPVARLQGDGGDHKQRRLMLPYTPQTNLPQLLTQVAESRLPLNRLLESSSRLAERGLPRVINSVDSTLSSARALTAELRQQSRQAGGEVRATASATRRTLSVYHELGRDGLARLGRADADLRDNAPLLLGTLRDLDRMSVQLNRLVDRISNSWLFDLLADPSRVPAPLGPAPQRTLNPASGDRSPLKPDPKGALQPPATMPQKGQGIREGHRGDP